ncbi:MAG: TetR/AcrR family transcriptional regulator [Gemmatimonadaceae bacterium]|nr:TetR/AcrR family transcriptional regulator [Gemmatimonadaceae bacterium]
MNHGADTETRILEAAHAVFVRRGTAGARMQEIAAEAGVNQALLHYYFRTKAQLAQAVFARAAGHLFRPVVDVLVSDLEIEDKVRRVIAIELELLGRTPFLPAYFISEMNQHPERVLQLVESASGTEIATSIPRVTEVLGRQLRRAARAGTMRPVTAAQFLMDLLSLCIFPFAARPMLMAVLQEDAAGFERLLDRRKRELPSFFLDALRPSEAS